MKAIFFILIIEIIISCDNSSNSEDNTISNSSKGKVIGNLIDESTGLPIISASIYTEPSTGSYTSDNEGKYNISEIDSGYYKIIAAKDGYNSNSINVYVKNGKITNADIKLSKYVYIDRSAYIEVKVSCKRYWPVTVSFDNVTYPAISEGIETYKTKEGSKSVVIKEWNGLLYSCDKKNGKKWTFNFNLKRGETRQLSVECCD